MNRSLGLFAALALVAFTLTATVATQENQAPPAAGAAVGGQGAPAGTGAAGAGRGRIGGRGGDNSVADFSPKPAYLPRTPAEEAKGFRLPAGYRMELIAADPEITNPVAIEFDGNGRMYLIEMIGYMMDAEASREHDPISRISRWESTNSDGRYDKHTIFADKMVAPRMVLPLADGVILTSETDSDDLLKLSDTNGDGVADKREVVWTGIGQSGDPNIEHQKAGLMWGLDNWIYTTYNSFRIRWTPSGFLREPTGSNGGQWGLGMDDDGKPWFVDAGGERGPMNFQYPIHYGGFTPCSAGRGGGFGGRGAQPGDAPPPPNPNCPAGMDGGFEPDFAVVWPPPGIGDMQGGLGRTRLPAQNLNHFTAATGPAIVRGDKLPDLKGDLLFTEPVGRLIRRTKIENVEGLTLLRNAYPQAEFMTSEDQLFRPVNISNAPDGTVFIVDMYHGIIQERQWSGPGTYLRAKIEQYQLDKVATHGRIWRLRYDGRAAVPTTDTNPGQPAIPGILPDFTAPRMFNDTPAQLVARLTHPNGWYRDTAQRLLIVKQDKSVVPALQQMARSSDNLLARIHAVWTLEGLNALDAALARDLMKDTNPRMRVQAIRASETLYKAGTKSLAAEYEAMTRDADTNVAIQALLTVNLFKTPNATDVQKAAQASNAAKGVKLIAGNMLNAAATPAAGGGRGMAGLSNEEQQLVRNGGEVFNGVCFSCHGADGRGQALAGSAVADAMMAPPIAGSPRVRDHRDYVIKVLLHGMTGPLGDKTYSEVMVPMGANTDAWIAGIASYVRTSFGNAAGLVTAEDVARVRAETARRKTPWTLAELEPTLPRAIDPGQIKLTASHGETVENAQTLRGWSTGTPQTSGMWFQIELTVPANVSEVLFESPTSGRGGGPGGGRGAPGAAPGAPAPAPPPPVYGAPRGFSVAVSMDGKTWSKPVAIGKSTGARTDINFTPTRAKFVRITQTDTVDAAPAWGIRNLRVYEKPATAGK